MLSIESLKKITQMFLKMKAVNKIIVLFLIFIIMSGIYMGAIYYKDSKRIREYKNTEISETVYINNRKFVPSDPYKERNEIIFVALDDVIKALGEKVDYEEKSFGKIIFNYQDKVYEMKKGSNIVIEKNSEKEIKMDGRVEMINGHIYTPVEFVLEDMPLNVMKASENRLFIDSFKSNFDYSWTKDNKYIAHAMGGIDQKTYTNSLEAFERNYKNGYRVFEADIAMTLDNEPVLLHAWGGATELGLPKAWEGKAVRYSDFKDQKIHGVYTTLSFRDLCEKMKENKDMYSVIDLKTDAKESREIYKKLVSIAKEVDASVLDRMIPQIYDENMYDAIMDTYEFKSMIYSLYKQEELNAKDIIDFSYEHGIKVVVIEGNKFNKKFVEELYERDIMVYMNTYNSAEEISYYTKYGVKGFFSDFINPVTEKNPYMDEEEKSTDETTE